MKTILKPSGEDSFWKDAIRDLVVVVVGILAALWLESWWQDQADRREEQHLLVGLRVEFLANRTQMESRIETWQRARRQAGDLHELMGGPITEETLADFKSIHSRGNSNGGRFFFDPRQGQLTSVINSGKLGLIENAELRSLIADWPALVADHDFDQKLWIQIYMGPHGQLLSQHFPSWPDSQFEYPTAELMQNSVFDNSLEGVSSILGLMIREGIGIIEATDRIVSLIDAEIGDA